MIALPGLTLATGRFEDAKKIIGIGTISEIFDGDWPLTPRGCIAQAWSVDEILRAYNLSFLTWLSDVERRIK